MLVKDESTNISASHLNEPFSMRDVIIMVYERPYPLNDRVNPPFSSLHKTSKSHIYGLTYPINEMGQ